jgi:hypothetical protein
VPPRAALAGRGLGTPPRQVARPAEPGTLPAERLSPATYGIDPARSDLRILVYRAGRLAHLGHNHVVEARAIEGRVDLTPDPEHSEFRLSIPVTELVVDDAAARARSGDAFTDPIEPESIAGTRKNMLGPQVLAAERWPEIRLDGRLLEGPLDASVLAVTISIRGIEQERQIPVRIRALSRRELGVSGQFSVRQTELGMTPVTAVDGALRVRDEVELVFDLVAVRP